MKSNATSVVASLISSAKSTIDCCNAKSEISRSYSDLNHSFKISNHVGNLFLLSEITFAQIVGCLIILKSRHFIRHKLQEITVNAIAINAAD